MKKLHFLHSSTLILSLAKLEWNALNLKKKKKTILLLQEKSIMGM